MPNLYNKKHFYDNWKIVEGFFHVLESNYNLLVRTEKESLIYPIVDEMFHTQEKIALCLIIVKKGSCVVDHKIIRKDFIEFFESDSRFKEVIQNYSKIFDLKDSLIYRFDETVDLDKLEEYMDLIREFKEQAEYYLMSKGVEV